MSADGQSASPSGLPLVQIATAARRANPIVRRILQAGVIASALLIVSVLVWQGYTAAGNPDPTTTGISPTAAVMDTGVLVFREGLEAILVLAALTASLVRTEEGYWKPVALGASVSFIATVITWFVVVALISDINAPAYAVQAATGLLAVVVLLVIMNWFFHKIYWTGWITFHNRRKLALTGNPSRSRAAIFRGLAIIGFTSVYREGFEIVLFLQSIRLQVGSRIILIGVLIGLALTGIVAMLTFVAHYKLPYKRMLVLTGLMIGVVLFVMVGEQVFEMQQAKWIPTTTLQYWNGHAYADRQWPEWLNTWFSIYPCYQSLIAQAATVLFVVGSYYLARRVCVRKGKAGAESVDTCLVPDCNNCELSQTNHIADQSQA